VRKGLVWTLAVLLVLGVGGYFGDNWLRGYAQDRAVEAAGSVLGDGTATIRLGGTPFFLALITRSVPSARVEVATVPLEISGKEVQLTDVVADTGTVTLGAGEVGVASLTGSAILSYADLSKIAGMPVTPATDGRLKSSYTVELFGQELSFTISALPEVDVPAQVIRLTKPKVELDLNDRFGEIALSQDQVDAIVKPITVQLDHELRLTSISPGDDGVAVGVEGTNLRVPIS
jgi:hypothetical protein